MSLYHNRTGKKLNDIRTFVMLSDYFMRSVDSNIGEILLNQFDDFFFLVILPNVINTDNSMMNECYNASEDFCLKVTPNKCIISTHYMNNLRIKNKVYFYHLTWKIFYF